VLQNEGDAHVARFAFFVDQEVRTDVQLTVVFLVEARRLLQVIVDDVFRQGEAEALGNPALLFLGGRLEIDPDGFERRQGMRAVDLFLEQPTVDECEDVEHAVTPPPKQSGWHRRAGLASARLDVHPLGFGPQRRQPLRAVDARTPIPIVRGSRARRAIMASPSCRTREAASAAMQALQTWGCYTARWGCRCDRCGA
jgi:hypothetical protein